MANPRTPAPKSLGPALRLAARRGLLATVAATLSVGGAARALDIAPGDLLAVSSGPTGLWRIDPVDGRVVPLVERDALTMPLGGGLAVAAGPDGEVYILTLDGLLRFGPDSDTPEFLVDQQTLSLALDVEVDGRGRVVVAGFGGAFEVDPADGSATPLPGSVPDWGVGGIALAPSGDLYGVIWLDPALDHWSAADGSIEEVTRDGFLEEPYDAAVGPDGRVYIADGQQDGVVRVNVERRNQVLLTRLGLLDDPIDLDFEADGRLVVADPGTGAVVRVDPETREQSYVVPPGTVDLVSSIAVVPAPEPGAALQIAGVALALAVLRPRGARERRVFPG